MENQTTTIQKATVIGGIVLVVLNALLITGASVTGAPILTLVNTVVLTVFTFAHGVRRYGWRRFLLFFGIVFVVSWSYESLSVLTGFPFGNYNYTDNFIGPWIGLVPLMIMPAYFSMGYLSWTIATVLLDKRDAAVKGSEIVLLPLLASFVMVFWDLSMDPMNATIGQFWVWHDGGAYFGVPFVNFMGWFLCVFTFYFLFALVLRDRNSSQTQVTIRNRAFWVLPVLMYDTRTIQYFLNALLQENRPVTAPDGQVWWTGDIYQSLALVSLFTMIFFFLYAIVRIARSADLAASHKE